MQPGDASSIENRRQQPAAQPLPPIRRQKTHPQHAAMSINQPRLGRDITPADDVALGRYSDKLRMTARNIVEYEFAGRLQRRSFEEPQIAPLARHAVERAMKPFDVVGPDRNDLDVISLRHC